MNPELFKISQEARTKLLTLLASAEVKSLVESTKDASDSGTFMGMVISTEHQDRQGEIVRQAGIDTTDFMQNPVVLNSHNYNGIANIVGVTTRLYPGTVDGVPATLADGKFAPTEEGQLARTLWEGGFMNAASIGFMPTEFDPADSSVITKSQLLEYSFVPVPANAKATRLRTFKDLGLDVEVLRSKGFVVAEEKSEEIVPETKADQLGDSCELDDASPGVLAQDPKNPDGPLICVPIEAKAVEEVEQKGAVADELASEEILEAKYNQLDEFFELVWAFVDVYMDEATTPDQFPTLLAEFIAICQEGIPTGEADENADGTVKSITIGGIVKQLTIGKKTVVNKFFYTKAGRAISAANGEKITKCMDMLKTIQGEHLEGVITALGELSSSAGGEDQDTDEGTDSSKTLDDKTLNEMNDFTFARNVMREIDKSVGTLLEEFNRRAKHRP